ncbi:DUF4426 domain-containing protein [Gilvimarinus agarilyticus]|uniref:DUF4426 domain-containing protein n=1 Tax=Gilvimarinus agarilyticus TaxID=679259 RepID=UPI000696F7CF|nr:DUF4426 domain-containing protein [Gilvimarinus agarilyticus]
MTALQTLARAVIAISFLLASNISTAADIPDATVLDPNYREQTFGDYTVHFSTFNSAFVTPEVAEIYGITRARNQVLVNVSVTQTKRGKTSLGLPANVTGTASNLLQQQRVLEFDEINEGDATYYLAPLKHSNEEVYNFTLNVTPTDAEQTGIQPLRVKFSRKLYFKEAE